METTPLPSVQIIKSTKAALGVAGVSQAALGRYLGVSKTQMTFRFNGTTRIQIDELVSIAHLFGVDVNDLIKGPGAWLDAIDIESVKDKIRDTRGYQSPERRIGVPA